MNLSEAAKLLRCSMDFRKLDHTIAINVAQLAGRKWRKMKIKSSSITGCDRRSLIVGAAASAANLMAARSRTLAANGVEEEFQIDPLALQRVVDRASELDQLRGLIVAQSGEILFAKAFRGPSLDRSINVKSVSKTIVAALTGAALDRGLIDNVNQRIGDLAYDLIPTGADPRVHDITVADLLTMQAGLERTSGRNYGRWIASDDWVRYALARPFIANPGERMLYSTGSYHILGAILAKLADASLLEIARAWLGRPLEIDIPPWTRDPQGLYLGGNNMELSPFALLRFGEMVRRGGHWQGKQVLSPGWLEASWTPRTSSPYSGHRYGYGWFLAHAGIRDLAYARGYGGQMLYVVPSIGLVVVITSDPTRPARSYGYGGDLHALVAELISQS
jgi:CubicO group peptidase (beta-lactamase class C family)